MLVIDASVAFKFVVEELGSSQALAYLDTDEPLIAPDLILIEVASALWKRVKESELLELHAERSLHGLPEFFARIDRMTDYMDEAFRLSFRLRHPIYDCIYLAQAVRENAVLVTADKKLVKAAARTGLGQFVRQLVW
ncbi:type II toxin-antitoxin system VapC family toxin [Novosphingobium lentum]|uniref:type II toxin-antitoxin system VapC family toxin n=1 Tax=Novosphingobium lentum TaxID=145287 RepID=UPI0008328451|nr:type II toxin-antitoxin system VapC family toxin [Novosphingobium lentum]